MELFIPTLIIFILLGFIILKIWGIRSNLINYGRFDKPKGFQKPTMYLKDQQMFIVVFQVVIGVLIIPEFLLGLLILDYLTFGSF